MMDIPTQPQSDGRPDSQTAEYDPTALREVKMIIKCLGKFIQGKKLYAKNNPLLTSFSKEITSAFDAFFRHEDELVLSVDQYSIRWEEQVVYENSRREESMAFLLYKDGIGELTFQNSLNFEEVERFAHIIIDEMVRSSPEDDVVTKMWKADFDHISYRVLDEYLSGEYGEGVGTEKTSDPSPLDLDDHAELLPMFRDNGRKVVERNDELDTLQNYYDKLVARSGITLTGNEREQYVDDLLAAIFQINSEELKLCHEELLREKQQDSIFQLMETMLDFITLSRNPSVMRDACNIIDRLVEYFINEKNAINLGAALRRVRNARNGPGLVQEAVQFYDMIERKLSHQKTQQFLTAGIRQWNRQAEEILAYIASLGQPGVKTLLNLLERAESVRLRHEICDHLFSILGDDVESIIERIGVEKSEVALAAIYLAGAAGLKTIPHSIKELVFYPILKVREEMVKYLAFSEDDEARVLLLKMLNDEEKKIRMKALGALEGKNYPEVRQQLDLLAFDKDVSKKSHDEQEAIFMILGSVGDGETVRKLRNMTGKRSMLFGRKRDNSVLAIRALEKIKLPESIQLLEELAGDSSPLVQTQAKRALENLRQNMDGDESQPH